MSGNQTQKKVMHFIILTKMKGVNHPVCEYDVLHCKQGLNYNNDNNNN